MEKLTSNAKVKFEALKEGSNSTLYGGFGSIKGGFRKTTQYVNWNCGCPPNLPQTNEQDCDNAGDCRDSTNVRNCSNTGTCYF